MKMVQLNPEIWVTTPLGDGLALIIIDYGLNHNTCWVVALQSNGQIKHFDSNDIQICYNHTYQINLKNAKLEI